LARRPQKSKLWSE